MMTLAEYLADAPTFKQFCDELPPSIRKVWEDRRANRYTRSYELLPDKTLREVSYLEGLYLHSYRDRVVAQDRICGWMVSTVFLGRDSSGHVPPMVFETMVMVNEDELFDGYWHYATWDDALKGHGEICEAVRRHRAFHRLIGRWTKKLWLRLTHRSSS